MVPNDTKNKLANLNLANLNLNGKQQPPDWRRYYYLLKQKKWFLIVPAILFIFVSFHQYLSLEPVYKSSTTILVSGGKLLTRSVRSVVPGVTAEEDIVAVKNYVLSGKCISELINGLGLKMNPGLRQKAQALSASLPDMNPREIQSMLFIEEVRENITVATRGRDLIEISASHKNPNKAYMMTKTLAQVFIDEFQKRQLGGVRGIREFSEEQLDIYERKLRKSEEKLRKFKQGVLKTQVMSDTSKTQESLKRLQADLVTFDVSIEDKHKRLALLQQRLGNTTLNKAALETSRLRETKQQIYVKIDELAKLLSTFGWRSPQVMSLNTELNDLREAIRQEVEKTVERIYSEKDETAKTLLTETYMATLDLDILRYQEQAIIQMIEKIEANLTQGPTHEMTLKNLQEEVEYHRQLYLNFLKQSQGTQIEEQIQRRDAEFRLQVVELAKKPLYPENMGMKTNLILACLPFFGLALGGGVVVALDYLDHSVSDVEEFEKEFNLSVWGIIPEIDESESGVAAIILQFLLVFLITGIGMAVIYVAKTGNLLTGF